MRLDQRAWVGFEPVKQTPPSQAPGGGTFSDIMIPNIKNTGKTPAEQVRVFHAMYTVDSSFVSSAIKDARWMDQLIANESALRADHVAFIYPSGYAPLKDKFIRCDPRFFPPPGGAKEPQGQIMVETFEVGVLPPESPVPVVLVRELDNPAITQTPAYAETIGHLGLIIYGRIEYLDVWGHHRHTKFCFYSDNWYAKAQRMPFRACPVFNEMR
jgi:hypothetical protein